MKRIHIIALSLLVSSALFLSACDRNDHDDEGHFHHIDRIEVRDHDSNTLYGVWQAGEDGFTGDGLPHLHDGDIAVLDVLFFDEDNHRAQLGGSGENSLGVRYATEADGQIGPDGVISFDVHGDHVHIEAIEGGETWIVFQLMHGSHSDGDSPPFRVEVDSHH